MSTRDRWIKVWGQTVVGRVETAGRFRRYVSFNDTKGRRRYAWVWPWQVKGPFEGGGQRD